MTGSEAGVIINLVSLALHNFCDRVTSLACKGKR